MIFSSITILTCEISPDSNIKTASDALWWSFVTITTVGYGDISPQEPATRLFALVYLFAAIVTTGKALSAVGDLLSVEDNTADTLLHKKLGKKGEARVVAGGVGVPFFWNVVVVHVLRGGGCNSAGCRRGL